MHIAASTIIVVRFIVGMRIFLFLQGPGIQIHTTILSGSAEIE